MKVCAIDDINCYLLAKHLGPSVPETRDFVASHSLSRGEILCEVESIPGIFLLAACRSGLQLCLGSSARVLL